MLTILAVTTILAWPPQQMAEPPIPSLPTGRMQPISGNELGGSFLDLERSHRSGDMAEIWVLILRAEPAAISDAPDAELVDLILEYARIDCADRTYSMVASHGFSPDGRRVVWLPPFPAEPIQPGSAQSFFARVMCDGETPPSRPFDGGHEAARDWLTARFAR